MSSGSKGSRSIKGGARGGSDRSTVSNSSHSSSNLKQTKSDHNHNDKGKDVSVQKIAPTAEQLRIAQMIDNSHPEMGLQEKINQVMQVTGVSTDDAIIALYDCDNDVNSAIDALLEGEDQGEWRESTKKKKKAPVSKSKEETDSNKENRRVENKERSGTRTRGSGGPPRFRGRGGRSTREDANDGIGRGPRRGRMSNGSMPYSRGRGSRGRGSANSRTFQNRQPPGFTETIDTWECIPDKAPQEDSLQIDQWDEDPSGSTEEWDEWTGSLDKTTVFAPSVAVAAPATPVSPETMEKPETLLPGSTLSNNLDLSGGVTGSLLGSAPGTSPMHSSGGARSAGGGSINSTVSNLPASLPEAGSNLLASMNRSTLSTPPSQQYSSSVSSSTQSNSQPQSIDIATLLQKAAPCTSLGRLPPSQMPSVPSLGNSGTMSSGGQASILSSMSGNVGDSMKSNVYVNNGSPGGPSAISSVTGQSYSSTSPSINDSIFSNSGLPSSVSGNLGNSLSNNSGMKVINLNSNSNLTSRSKPQRSRLGQSSKIPSSAVEMPEDAMAALDVQFSGLEFGTETFDFSSEVKTLVGSSLVSGPSINARDPSTVSNSVSKDIGTLNSTLSQPQSNYSSVSSSGVGGSNTYPGGSSSVVNSTPNPSSNNQSASGYGTSFSVQGSATSGSVQYPNSFVSTSSHSSLASISVPKTLSGLKESSQSYNDSVQSSSSLSGSLSSNNVSGGGTNSGSGGLSSSLSSASNSAQPTKSTVPGKSVNSMGSSVPPGVQQHGVNTQQQQQQQMVQPLHLSQQHQSHHHPLQQQVAQQAQQQTQQTPQLMAPGPSQYVSPTAALQGALPTAFYNVQQPAMYSYEDLQMFQRIPHLQTAPTSLPGGRDGQITSPASYSVADASKFRTDQNSSPVPSTINQQGATAAGTYITAAGNAMPPFYMPYNIPAVPSSFPQYGHPAIIQLPPNTHTGSSTTQFPGPPKLPYPGTSTYYDNLSQAQDYKPGYGSGSQGPSKSGATSAGSASNSGSDLSGYKNHLSKVSRSYDKQGFHTGTPPPFSLPGSGSNPMTANPYAPPMFIQTMPPAAQHHSTLMHHQLHQDGGSTASQRAAAAGVQNKAAAKAGYSGSYWSSN